MSIEIKLPDIGSDEVEVTELLVNVGDHVDANQSILTVEGDKASMEIPAPRAGTVKEIKIKVGDKVTTGKLVMIFEDNVTEDKPLTAVSSAVLPTKTTLSASEKSMSQVINVPDIGTDEVEVTSILVTVGETVTTEQSLITVEGEKASMDIPSPVAGKVTNINVKVGDKVKTGVPIMVFDIISNRIVSTKTSVETPTSSIQPAKIEILQSQSSSEVLISATASDNFVENDAYVHASPVIRRLAREFGINLSNVHGSGRKRRILREDVQTYVKQAVKGYENGVASSGGMPGLLPWPKVDFSKFGEIEEQELTKIQKISGANLHRNWVVIPHVTHFDETDITDMEEFRKQQNAEAEKRKLDVKITPVVFLMKAAASALVSFPRFNSSLTEDGQKLIIKKYINIGIAVDTPNGLIVPVFKNVDKKGMIELSRELAEISKKARAGKLTTADMQGGCFTISSLGGIGTTAFTPIVNAPEVSILGVSRSAMKPVWDGKEFVPRLMLPLSLSFDHRVIDGADAARFITHISNVMSDIRRLVM